MLDGREFSKVSLSLRCRSISCFTSDADRSCESYSLQKFECNKVSKAQRVAFPLKNLSVRFSGPRFRTCRPLQKKWSEPGSNQQRSLKCFCKIHSQSTHEMFSSFIFFSRTTIIQTITLHNQPETNTQIHVHLR